MLALVFHCTYTIFFFLSFISSPLQLVSYVYQQKCSPDFCFLFAQAPNNSVPDPLCNILGLNSYMGKTSTSCPPDVPQVKTEPAVSDQQLVAYMKDRQKKDNHNMSEWELIAITNLFLF